MFFESETMDGEFIVVEDEKEYLFGLCVFYL